MTKQSSKYNGAPDGATLPTGLPRYARNDKRTSALVRRRHIFKFYILKLHHFITLSLYH